MWTDTWSDYTQIIEICLVSKFNFNYSMFYVTLCRSYYRDKRLRSISRFHYLSRQMPILRIMLCWQQLLLPQLLRYVWARLSFLASLISGTVNESRSGYPLRECHQTDKHPRLQNLGIIHHDTHESLGTTRSPVPRRKGT